VINLLSVYNKSVYLLHFLGFFKNKYKERMLQIANEQEVSIPDNLSIVSPISSDIKEISPLHIQLTKNHIKYFNSDRVDENNKWDRRKKPVYVLDGLNKVETEYCMVLDGKDTCFT
jgi:hypothetical protein